MNPKISELLDKIANVEEHKAIYDEWYEDESMSFLTYIKVRTTIRNDERKISFLKERIRQISSNISPQVPEPWASMTADDIIKSLGVYR